MSGINWSADDLAKYNERRKKTGDKIDKVVVPTTSKPKAKRQHLEQDLQIACVDWLKWGLDRSWKFFHIPNEMGNRTIVENKILSACGVIAGAADLLILSPQGRFFWLELKSPTGSLSKDQKIWRDWCQENLIPWALIRCLEDLIDFCARYQIPVRAR